MLISRWQAPTIPSREQIMMLLDIEGLEGIEEKFAAGDKILEHRHPFTEVRVLIQGELLFNVSGNQFLIRAGDRIEIPANTKHWFQSHGDQECVCVYAQRVI